MKVGIGLILLLLSLASPALAHDHTHPELTPWYQSLHGAGPCCDGSEKETKALTDAEWRVKDGHYQVYINQFEDSKGEYMWVDVPPGAVVKGPNLDGRTLVWPVWGFPKPAVRCFLPGPGT